MAYLELRNITKSFDNIVAVDNVDLAVNAGEFLALLGPSGCGKTTTLRIIAGFVVPSAGEVWVRDINVTGLPPQRRNMGMVFQNYALFPHMTVRANIEFGPKSHRVPAAVMNEQVQSVLALVGLSPYADRYPRELSGGQQQRVALARVLVLKPDLLLFDEPLSNLDAKLRVQMRYEIRRLQREVGVTAIFVTHDQEEAMTIADRIVVLDKGRIEQVGTPQEIYDRPRTRFVADFIGISNFFEGILINNGRGFRCKSGLEFSLDVKSRGMDRGVVAVRPEKIEFVELESVGGLRGCIKRATQIGATMEYVVELTSNDRTIVQEQRRPDAKGYREGETVAIRWRPEDSVLLPV